MGWLGCLGCHAVAGRCRLGLWPSGWIQNGSLTWLLAGCSVRLLTRASAHGLSMWLELCGTALCSQIDHPQSEHSRRPMWKLQVGSDKVTLQKKTWKSQLWGRTGCHAWRPKKMVRRMQRMKEGGCGMRGGGAGAHHEGLYRPCQGFWSCFPKRLMASMQFYYI